MTAITARQGATMRVLSRPSQPDLPPTLAGWGNVTTVWFGQVLAA